MDKKHFTLYHRFINLLSGNLGLFISKLHAVLRKVRYEKYMLDFEERDDDIYVVTYPKSGTTLTQMLLYQLFTDGNIDFKHIYDVSPWIRNDVLEGFPARTIDHRRIIKSHDTYHEMPRVFKGKIIYVYRDGMDTATSLYQQNKDYKTINSSFDDFLKNSFFGDGRMNWVQFSKEWFENKNKYEILYLSYDELTQNKKETIEKITKYCKLDNNQIDVDRVLERTSFDFMKKHEIKFGDQPPKEKRVFDNFIRNGKSGSGKELFSDQQKEFYHKAHLENITPLLDKVGLKENK